MKTLTTAGLLIAFGLTHSAFAQSDVSHHSEQTSKHSALAVSHAGASTGQVASAVVAVPIVSGAVVSAGVASTAQQSAEVAIDIVDYFSQPLVVTEYVVTVDPAPHMALDAKTLEETAEPTVRTTKTQTIEVTKKTTTVESEKSQ
ncbi:MAG: hypothetical protein AAGJ37_09415 [Pseudomonadota bacterium]